MPVLPRLDERGCGFPGEERGLWHRDGMKCVYIPFNSAVLRTGDQGGDQDNPGILRMKNAVIIAAGLFLSDPGPGSQGI